MAFKLLTKEEAARRARISTRCLHTQIANGTGPAVTRIGRRVFVRTDSLQEWLQRCTPRRKPALPSAGVGA